LVYSTYLGGYGTDWGNAIAVDSSGNAYVTGLTGSKWFPTQSPLQNHYGGKYDAFVSKFDSTGSTLVYSTYLGGIGSESGYGIAVDSAGNAYVTGGTSSTDFPMMNPLQRTYGGGLDDAFVAKVAAPTATATTLSSSRNPSAFGQSVTFTATVTSSLGAPPDGEAVTFKKGTTVLGTGTLSGGSASFTTSALPVGTDSIKAVYRGDSNFGGSTSKVLKQVVNKATTKTTLASSQNPSNVGQSVTFTATVTPQFSGTVTGTVTFYDGTTALKTAALSGGVAKFTTSTLTLGSHSITATYNGSISFIGSSASLTQTVN
jgi:Bacterial Ig-like domain (group 3)/Beta-propeller repeat